MVRVALSREENTNLIFYFSFSFKHYLNVDMLRKKIVVLTFSSIVDDLRRSERERRLERNSGPLVF